MARESRLINRSPCPPGPSFEGLVIDDYFIIGQESTKVLPALESAPHDVDTIAKKGLDLARAAYDKRKVAGSSEKDVVNATTFTVAGASVDSSRSAVRNNLVPVASPAEKRCALSLASLAAARLPVSSRALIERLVGGWIHAMMFRRPTAVCFAKVYKFIHDPIVQASTEDTAFSLSRGVADELVVCSILAPLMATNLVAQLEPTLYASDASMAKGAVVSTGLSSDEALLLWRTAERKGGYTRLDPAARALLKSVGDPDLEEQCLQGFPVAPQKSPPLRFDFVEVCAGAGKITHYCNEMGLACCPPLDLEHSAQYDLQSADVIPWLVEMIREGRLRSVFVSPPCTTFSPAAFPSLRSYEDPWGNHSIPRVRTGNVLALRALALVFTARTYTRAGCVEQPRRSKMAWLKVWLRLRALSGILEVFLAACQFGSVHKKEFRFLGCNLDLHRIARPCRGGHEHVVIQGKWTKASAVYPDALARELAMLYGDFVTKDRCRERELGVDFSGLESPIINELLAGRQWKLEKEWRWKRHERINMLEMRGLVVLLKSQPAAGPDRRILHLFDSAVALAASVKGRSSSYKLRRLLCQICALALALGVYFGEAFAPTRHNIADDPTRSAVVRPALEHSFLPHISMSLKQQLAQTRVRRFAANWIRLVLILVHCVPAKAALPSASASIIATDILSGLCSVTCLFPSGVFSPRWIFMDFPLLPAAWTFFSWTLAWIFLLGAAWTVLRTWTPFTVKGQDCYRSKRASRKGPLFLFRVGFLKFGVLLVLLSHGASAAPSLERYRQKAEERAFMMLSSHRAVLPKTDLHRKARLADFGKWLTATGACTLEELLSDVNAEEVNKLLVDFGQALFREGRPYGHFSELINAVAASRPVLRRQLIGAWDLAYNWMAVEPHVHHMALPALVLVAMLATCLLWGWTREAGLFSLMWGGLCRPGEVLTATRKHLVLPQDVMNSQPFALLRIEEPKTRRRAAKHQAAKVDLPDLMEILVIAFAQLNPASRLWPYSGQTLRARFRKVCTALGLPETKKAGSPALELGSFRPGGATWLLQQCENPELVRRRGRWLSPRVMEIYLQEVEAATFLVNQQVHVREKVQQVASVFPALLEKAVLWNKSNIPAAAWFYLFQHERRAHTTG